MKFLIQNLSKLGVVFKEKGMPVIKRQEISGFPDAKNRIRVRNSEAS
jgi:hypothetical protein